MFSGYELPHSGSNVAVIRNMVQPYEMYLRPLALAALLLCGGCEGSVGDGYSDGGPDAVNDGPAPGQDGGTTPGADGGAKPADKGAKPADKGAKPADKGVKPVDKGVKPVDKGKLHFTIMRLGNKKLEAVGVSASATSPTGKWSYVHKTLLKIMVP